jgi:hypothetical protein
MSKKYTVIQDLEDFKVNKGDGGMYAIMPYERLDKHGNALFKVGQAKDFRKRFESYHTYYPDGFYYKSLLKNPRANRKNENGERILNEKTYYNKVEKSLHQDIIDRKGKRLLTTTRVKNSKINPENLGDTEWFYTDPKTLDKAFKATHQKFGGSLYNKDLDHINKEARKASIGANYKAEIYYKIR